MCLTISMISLEGKVSDFGVQGVMEHDRENDMENRIIWDPMRVWVWGD